MTWVFVLAGFFWLGILLSLTLTEYASRFRPTPSSSAQVTLQPTPHPEVAPQHP
jgi:hypothetical protein